MSNVGTWIGRVTQDWVVLTELTHHDAAALGAITATQFAPVVLLAPFAGSLADAYPKRRLLMLSQSALAVTSLVLARLLLTGSATLASVFGIGAGSTGAAATSDGGETGEMMDGTDRLDEVHKKRMKLVEKLLSSTCLIIGVLAVGFYVGLPHHRCMTNPRV